MERRYGMSNLKPYIKIDGVLYKSICDYCHIPLTAHGKGRCWQCWKDSIKGQVRVKHSTPHNSQTRKRISETKMSGKDFKDLSYLGKHARVRTLRGKPNKCENIYCLDKSKKYEWASISGQYTDIDDFVMLCRSCHSYYDWNSRKLKVEWITR